MSTPPPRPPGPTPPGGPTPPKRTPPGKPIPKVVVPRPAPARKAPAWWMRARRVLLEPRQEWAVVAPESATLGSIYKGFLLPMAAIGPIAATVGTIISGGQHSSLSGTYTISVIDAVTSGVLEYGLNLGAMYLLALTIAKVGEGMGSQGNVVQALKVAAYGSTPYWLGGIVAILPKLSPLGILAGLYSCRLFALGLVPVMKAPEGKAGVYTLVTSVVGIMLVLLISAILQIILNN